MFISKKSILSIGFLLMLSLFLAACSGSGDKTNTDSKDKAKGDTKGGDLIIASLSDARSLDPHSSNDVPSSNVASNIYETLVYLDENMEPTPLLAESWESIDDLTWEFKLKKDVKFHDGSDFNANVVKANLDRILDEKIASPRAFLFEMVTDVEVVDDYTVRIKTEYPFAPLLSHFSHTGGGMISEEAIKKDYEEMENGREAGSYISENPVGTSYFKFEEWVPGEKIKLVRNEDYWGDKAKLNSVTFKVVPEALTRVADIETAAAHVIEPVSPSDLSRVDGLSDASVHRQASASLSYVGFNAEKEPFNDVRVRQAISLAIDQEGIISGIYEGTGIPAVGPLAPDVFGYDKSVKKIPFDPEKAKELLAEAGFPDGFSTTIWTNDNPDRIKIAEYLQSKLKDIGITVKVEVLEWGAYLDNTANGKHDMFILGWSVATGDADYGLYPMFHSENVGEPGNRTFLKDPELDALLEQGRKEFDTDKRAAIYKEAQEKIVDLAPMVYIHHQEYLIGIRDEVKGFRVDPDGIFQLKDVTIE
ncbi:glutathione ABC transporter substrate-binding protein [Bacillus aquiflavi]|uniref:Glutathione ABC transporter substrate-binding protein n=1 Tax=Bacillus aquiflavi TaxID=2672567 RepID=A0A6B3VP72_9BACI|nr:glutathione ABC transporter substrate-binding protein [Bacillus aquiflavi]MBA4535734.1 glutathione ABC transporter substrate-binding protein [Bacillus aquiflavi]NEY80110.1 glutathione ABC transporter substrate-binding protein [Bacillus aquiflavi]UAC47997.1 glutathione ABC transporter substrate-binding protein [Bacillus aquiflavi]